MQTDNLQITTPIAASLLRGAIELEQTAFGILPHRLPAWTRAQFPDSQLALIETEPSGVRLKFRTAATVIELDVLPTRRAIVGIPPRPKGIYDLCVNGKLERQCSAENAALLRTDMSTGTIIHEPGTVQTLRFEGLEGDDKLVEIWLPHNEIVELGVLRSNSPLRAVASEKRPIWVHHGSSISQGSNATSPTGTWPAIASRTAEVDLVNLGFGGNALLDPFVSRTIRDTPADIISVKIGINLVNADLMRLRAFGPAVNGFLDTIREGHPDKPLLVMSPIYCPIHEDTPGPGMFDLDALARGEMKFLATGRPEDAKSGRLTLTVIREQLCRIVEQRAKHDTNIHYLDGRTLYGEADHAGLPLPDRLHPDAESHRLMGRRFAPRLRSLLGS